MKTISRVKVKKITENRENPVIMAVTGGIFLLAFQLGQALYFIGIETAFLFFVLVTVFFSCSFLPIKETIKIGNWFIFNGFVAGLAIILGFVYEQSLKVYIPSEYKFLPTTLIIILTALNCCFLFYGFFKLKIVK